MVPDIPLRLGHFSPFLCLCSPDCIISIHLLSNLLMFLSASFSILLSPSSEIFSLFIILFTSK